MPFELREWEAWYNDMPGPDKPPPVLNVLGIGEATHGGYRFKLDVGNQGTPGDPSLLRIRLEAQEGPGPEVITQIQLQFVSDVGTSYKRVEIYGDANAVVEITNTG